jgi:excisionase family DNA binding protein
VTPPKAIRHLTPEELSERLGIPVETLKRWRRTGDGPKFMRVGRHVRYRLADVEAYEKSCLAPAAA